jgi:hypothetical protein
MIELVVGLRGSGKTKLFFDKVNAASENTKGDVVCVEYGKKLTFNVNMNVRLIDVVDYGVSNGEELYGFICGIISSNYDITEIYIDSALKMCGNNVDEFEKFILRLADRTDKYGIKCFITSSIAAEDIPVSLSGYLYKSEN